MKELLFIHFYKFSERYDKSCFTSICNNYKQKKTLKCHFELDFDKFLKFYIFLVDRVIHKVLMKTIVCIFKEERQYQTF